MYSTNGGIAEIADRAREIRATVVEMLAEAGSGHTAGALGLADIFAALYFGVMRHNPQEPDWEGRDRLILSNGHVCPVLYAALAHAGYFPVEECRTLRSFGSRLQGHPERGRLPGVETTSGPLGEGLSQAAGMALALAKSSDVLRPNFLPRVYCVMSDGEHDEGSTWEAVLFAAKYGIGNLVAIVDRNGIQIDGPTEKVLPLEPLSDKYRSFNWNVIEADGNDLGAFLRAAQKARDSEGTPTVIIARTIPGKGVPEIEGDYRWHGKAPTREEAERFLRAIHTEDLVI